MLTANSTTDLERRLIDLQAALTDASDAADRLDNADASYDVGVQLLDARNAITAALEAIDRLTAPQIGPFFAPTVVRSAVLDAAYAQIDECFA